MKPTMKGVVFMAGNRPNYTPEEAQRFGSLGGKASAEARRRKKTLGEYLQAWASMKPDATNLKKLAPYLPQDEDFTNKAMLVLPLIKKANAGDIKAIDMIVKLIGEDRKLEAEIEKLKAENELLKQGSGILLDKIVINMDVKPDEH
jgi:hypothetical protein